MRSAVAGGMLIDEAVEMGLKLVREYDLPVGEAPWELGPECTAEEVVEIGRRVVAVRSGQVKVVDLDDLMRTSLRRSVLG